MGAVQAEAKQEVIQGEGRLRGKGVTLPSISSSVVLVKRYKRGERRKRDTITLPVIVSSVVCV